MNTNLLEHLLCSIEFLPVLLQTQIQITDLLSLSFHLVSQHTDLKKQGFFISKFMTPEEI